MRSTSNVLEIPREKTILGQFTYVEGFIKGASEKCVEMDRVPKTEEIRIKAQENLQTYLLLPFPKDEIRASLFIIGNTDGSNMATMRPHILCSHKKIPVFPNPAPAFKDHSKPKHARFWPLVGAAMMVIGVLGILPSRGASSALILGGYSLFASKKPSDSSSIPNS